jgi:lambda family phage portal protein
MFTRQQLFHVAAATGVPYETLTGDMSRVNDRTVRVILTEFRRRIQAWQHQVVAFKVCRTVWKAWLDRAFLSDSIDIPVDYIADPEPWAKVKWMPQGWPYIHPVQDVQASKESVRCGFKSRAAVVSEQGDDSEEVDAEQASDNERADELGLKYDSDGRTSANAAQAPAPPEDQETPEMEPGMEQGMEPAEVPA